MSTVHALKPKSGSRSETRARLVRAGTEILSERGFVGSGLEEILDRAGVPKGSFYYYFESKAKFGIAVIDNYEYLWAQKLTRLLTDPAVAPLRRIDNYIDEAIHGLKKYDYRRGCLIGNLGQEMSSLEEEFRLRLLKVLRSWESFVGTCLREAQDKGELSRDVDVGEVAGFFWSAWEGAILLSKVERTIGPIRRFRSIMFKHVLTG